MIFFCSFMIVIFSLVFFYFFVVYIVLYFCYSSILPFHGLDFVYGIVCYSDLLLHAFIQFFCYVSNASLFLFLIILLYIHISAVRLFLVLIFLLFTELFIHSSASSAYFVYHVFFVLIVLALDCHYTFPNFFPLIFSDCFFFQILFMI
jgi:hypothetical protein